MRTISRSNRSRDDVNGESSINRLIRDDRNNGVNVSCL